MKTARRKRTEKEALQYLNDNSPPMPPAESKAAKARIRLSAQPNVEALRIVGQANKASAGVIVISEKADLSDVLELQVRLIRRDVVVSSPHLEMLNKLARDILTTGVSGNEFKKRATYILSIETALSKEFQRNEREFIRSNKFGSW
jgi:hypothetical protein